MEQATICTQIITSKLQRLCKLVQDQHIANRYYYLRWFIPYLSELLAMVRSMMQALGWRTLGGCVPAMRVLHRGIYPCLRFIQIPGRVPLSEQIPVPDLRPKKSACQRRVPRADLRLPLLHVVATNRRGSGTLEWGRG
jgi:hypothetical protein